MIDGHKALSIELEQVYKIYEIESQKIEALRGVDFSVQQGEALALIGRSGAGKSTMLHIIGALDKPTRGRVILNGQDVSQMSDRDASAFRNRSIGFVFQMNNLLPEFSALENVMLPGLIGGLPKQIVREQALELLGSVALSHRVSHRPGELSGGEQQRVAIARALLMSPSILLADEPTGNLDKKTSLGIQNLLFDLCTARSMTMILVTHDLELAGRLPRQVMMEDGRIGY